MAKINRIGSINGGSTTDTIVENRTSGNFYDLNRLKQIPITDVCQRLGVTVERRHNGLWCKAREEGVPSTTIHEGKNTFYDFGTNAGGDVISFVGYILELERKDAIRQLADMYHIEPVNPRTGYQSSELTDWEYNQIGLYGDMATKNFDFDMERMPIERIYEISNLYDMPMNELKKKHPKTYERIIRQKALPYLREMRNSYLLHVWNRYQVAREIGNPQLFYHGDLKSVFGDEIRELTNAERVLRRAVKDTSIKLPSAREYDPVKDLDLLSKGEIKPGLSEVGYSEMQAAAKRAGCAVRYTVMDYSKYLASGLDQQFHTAFFKAGRVVVGYLEKDWMKIKPVLASNKPSLTEQMRAAESARASSLSHGIQPSAPER